MIAICLGCGCTDDEPCAGGCAWIRLDRAAGEGICSNCEAHAARFDAGDRSRWYGEPEYLEGLQDEAPRLVLPGDPEFDGTLEAMRRQRPV